MAMTPEGKVKAMVNRRLKPYEERGQLWKFMPVQTGFGKPGLDYHITVGGRSVYIETKTTIGTLTARQQETCVAIRKAGGEVYIVRCEDDMAYVVHCIDKILADEALRLKCSSTA